MVERRLPPREPQRLPTPQPIEGRVPPHDLDAEAAVLSACLLSRDALDEVVDLLKPEHFYADANGRIFDACLELATLGQPFDIVTVATWLRDRGRLAQVGGPSYLAQLADATPAVKHVGAHAQVVYEKWRVRALIATCQLKVAEGYGDYGEPQAFLDGAEQAVFELARSEQRTSGGFLNVHLRTAFEKIQAAAERGDRVTGIPTGFHGIDALTSGMHEGDVTVVAARPGMGKSAFVCQLGTNVAAPVVVKVGGRDEHHYRYGAVIISAEMPAEQLAVRMVCTEGRVDLGKVRQGQLQPLDWKKLTDAAAFLASIPLWVEFMPGATALQARAKLRRVSAECEGRFGVPVKLAIFDYLQLMRGTGVFPNREQEVAQISRDMKVLAGDLKMHVVACAQLNREVEKRSDKRPILSDLRESGSVEQDADNVAFIFRDEYYRREESDAKGIAEIDYAKQRNGPTGRVKLRFTASCTRFDNLAPGDYPEEDEA